ncbi:hypothetical protein [Lysobacter gummosus]|uniref:hypothetical protein n=1 Tax=Lysobacter gummosus TaxID=262324 RepID=UPI00363EDA10
MTYCGSCSSSRRHDQTFMSVARTNSACRSLAYNQPAQKLKGNPSSHQALPVMRSINSDKGKTATAAASLCPVFIVPASPRPTRRLRPRYRPASSLSRAAARHRAPDPASCRSSVGTRG